MAIETTNKSPVNGPSQNKPVQKNFANQALQCSNYGITAMPPYLRDYYLRFPSNRRQIEIEALKRGEFVHGFSCCKCGFVLDERDICIACGLTSVRIMKWVCAQPDRFEEMGEDDDIKEYRTEKLVVKRQYQTRSSVKFALRDDPF